MVPVLDLNADNKVVLTRNLWTKYSLCNGAMGVVKTIIYKVDQYPPSLPLTFLVVLENYKGPTFDGYCGPVILILSNSNNHEKFEIIQVLLKLCWVLQLIRYY